MRRRDVLAGAGALALGAAMGRRAMADDKTVLKASDVHPEGYPTVQAVEDLGKKLEAATNGRLGVQMLADGSAAVSYIEFADKHSQLRVRKISPDGMRSPAVSIADASGGRYPRIARDRDELLFSWTEGENDATRVRTARASADWK